MGSTDDSMSHSPLAWLYDRFAAYIEDRRRSPRDDVLTALATTTFPDGTLPEVIDVVRVAANVFAAGQETTVRLLGAAVLLIAERPDLQQLLRDRRELIPDFVEETLRIESPVKGDFRLARRATTVGGVEIPAGATVMVLNGAANRDPGTSRSRGSCGSSAAMPASSWRSAAGSTAARAGRWPGWRAG